MSTSTSTNPIQNRMSGDGRERAVLEYVLSRREELQGKSDAILDAIDVWAEKTHLMNVGEIKGSEVERIMKETKPALVLELGTYVGYSGLRFARHVKEAYPDAATPDEWKKSGSESTKKVGYICLEFSHEYADIARQVMDLGGIGSVAKILVGPAGDSIKTLRETLGLGQTEVFDLVFIDHHKPFYVPDMQALEEYGLIGPGTTIIADNVIRPGAPEYLKYVRASPEERKTWYSTKGGEWEGKGVPGIKYENRLFMLPDGRDGIEISKYVGLEE